MSRAREKSFDLQASRAETARASPTAVFDKPEDVLMSAELTKSEKGEVLDQWEADAKALQTATDEGMSGGKPPRLDEVNAARTKLDATVSTSQMTEREKPEASIVTKAESARGALGPKSTSSGDSLLPMLLGGLVLVVVGLFAVLLFT